MFAAVLLAFAACATAQVREGESTIDLHVNYRLAYRDGTWVPVDVLVSNGARDIKGYVELRTYSYDRLQSPIYRIPAECPKFSRKRFRFHCLLRNTTRIQGMVYHRGRAVVPVAPWLDLQPIEREDLLALVLDNEPADYGFLNVALHAGDKPQRLYREEVRGEALGLLADYPQCYEPYDLIILGDLEPDQIGPRHRSLLKQYVNSGGLLVICTGENAPQYRGSWAEELAGVAIGPTRIVQEAELARLVLRDGEREERPTRREAYWADLIPFDPATKVWKHEAILATLRPFGSGHVVTLAVDAASHILQDAPGYQRLWRELCTHRREPNALRYEQAIGHYANQLPSISGVQLLPKSSVMTYLALYFLVGVIGNWLLFSALKRRELAWVALIVISAGFTAYAMVFGAAGRAKATMIDQVEVLRVPKGGGPSSLRSLVGILSARSTRHSIDLTNRYSLVEDVITLDPFRQFGRYSSEPSRPFYMDQGAPPRVEGLAIGASELRLFQVHTEVVAPGGIEGELRVEEGRLRGTLDNKTGYELLTPFVLVEGVAYYLESGHRELFVDAVPQHLGREENLRGWQGPAFPYAGRAEAEQTGQYRNLMAEFLRLLFVQDAFEKQVDPRLGPFLVAWAKQGPIGTIRSDQITGRAGGATLLIADIEVKTPTKYRGARQSLPVRIGNDKFQEYPRPDEMGWYSEAHRMSGNMESVDILVHPSLLSQEPDAVELRVYWSAPYHGCDIQLQSGGPSVAMRMVNQSRDHTWVGGESLSSASYRIDNWQAGYQESTSTIPLQIRDSAAYGPGVQRVSIQAQTRLMRSTLESEDWQPWQS